MASNPDRIIRQFEEHIPEKSGRAGLTWRFNVESPPPVSLGVVAGDVIHNLRSALDHLARELVIANGANPRDEGRPRTQFPIVTASEQQPVIHTESGDISSAAQVLLEVVQPNNRPDHPLAVLTRLANIDKHRTILFTHRVPSEWFLSRREGALVRGNAT